MVIASVRNGTGQYSLKGCKGSNIQGSARLADGGPDIRGSVQFGHVLMFPSMRRLKKKSVRIVGLSLVCLSFIQIVVDGNLSVLQSSQT